MKTGPKDRELFYALAAEDAQSRRPGRDHDKDF